MKALELIKAIGFYSVIFVILSVMGFSVYYMMSEIHSFLIIDMLFSIIGFGTFFASTIAVCVLIISGSVMLFTRKKKYAMK